MAWVRHTPLIPAVLAALFAAPAQAQIFDNITWGIAEDEVLLTLLYDGIYRANHYCQTGDTAACATYENLRTAAFEAYAASNYCVHDGIMSGCDRYAEVRAWTLAEAERFAAAYAEPVYADGTPDLPHEASLDVKRANLSAVFSPPPTLPGFSTCQALIPQCGYYDPVKVEAAQRAFIVIIGKSVPAE